MNDPLRRLTSSKANYWLSFVLDGVVATAMAGAGIAGRGGAGGVAVVAASIVTVAGFMTCSLYEYAFHRWWFHAHRAPLAQRLHELHHRAPAVLVGTPFFVSLVTCAATFGIGTLVTSPALAACFAGGLLLGHTYEGAIHHLIHHGGAGRSRWRRELQLRHLVHHRRSDVNFGVSSSLWDRLFGTESARDVRPSRAS